MVSDNLLSGETSDDSVSFGLCLVYLLLLLLLLVVRGPTLIDVV